MLDSEVEFFFYRIIKTQDQLKHVSCRQSLHKSHIFRQITHEQLIALVLIYITHPYNIHPHDCVCVHIAARGFLAANEQTQIWAWSWHLQRTSW